MGIRVAICMRGWCPDPGRRADLSSHSRPPTTALREGLSPGTVRLEPFARSFSPEGLRAPRPLQKFVFQNQNVKTKFAKKKDEGKRRKNSRKKYSKKGKTRENKENTRKKTMNKNTRKNTRKKTRKTQEKQGKTRKTKKKQERKTKDEKMKNNEKQRETKRNT